MKELKRGTVIQINENVKDWCGCLMIVDEVKSCGVQAGMKTPLTGTTYMRLKHDQFEIIGQAALVPVNGDDDE